MVRFRDRESSGQSEMESADSSPTTLAPLPESALLAGGCGFFRYRLLEIFQRAAQAFFELDFRLPAEQRAGFADVGPPLLGIVLRQRFVGNLAFRAGDFQH